MIQSNKPKASSTATLFQQLIDSGYKNIKSAQNNNYTDRFNGRNITTIDQIYNSVQIQVIVIILALIIISIPFDKSINTDILDLSKIF